MVVIADPLVEVAVRVHAEVAEHATLAEVLAVIARCRTGQVGQLVLDGGRAGH